MRIWGLILAAGESKRLPVNKMTIKFEDLSVIQRLINKLEAVCDHIVVVTGKYHQEISAHIAHNHHISIVENKDYKQGMFSSIKRGVEVLDCDLFFMTPGDVFNIEEKTLESLLASPGEVRIPSYQERAGHPILLSGHLKRELLSYEGPHMRAFIQERKRTYVKVEDENILKDLDTLEDLAQWERRLLHENK